jgi:hypothetical protein
MYNSDNFLGVPRWHDGTHARAPTCPHPGSAQLPSTPTAPELPHRLPTNAPHHTHPARLGRPAAKLIRKEEAGLLEELPFKLRSRLLTAFFADSLSRIPAAARLPPHVLIELVAQLKTTYYVEGERQRERGCASAVRNLSVILGVLTRRIDAVQADT